MDWSKVMYVYVSASPCLQFFVTRSQIYDAHTPRLWFTIGKATEKGVDFMAVKQQDIIYI